MRGPIPTIARSWEEYRNKFLEDMPRDRIARARDVFYAGFFVAIRVPLESRSSTMETRAHMQTLFDEYMDYYLGKTGRDEHVE